MLLPNFISYLLFLPFLYESAPPSYFSYVHLINSSVLRLLFSQYPFLGKIINKIRTNVLLWAVPHFLAKSHQIPWFFLQFPYTYLNKKLLNNCVCKRKHYYQLILKRNISQIDFFFLLILLFSIFNTLCLNFRISTIFFGIFF